MKKQIILLLVTIFLVPIMYYNTIVMVETHHLSIIESRLIYYLSGMLTVILISIFYKKT